MLNKNLPWDLITFIIKIINYRKSDKIQFLRRLKLNVTINLSIIKISYKK
jgi:hypothetical protein